MANKKRALLYLGVIFISISIIFLAYILTTGPYDKVQDNNVTIISDNPLGLIFKDVEPGDKLELNFESTKPVNVYILHPEDKGDFFTLEDRTVEHYIVAEESTAETIDYTFSGKGDWGVYFENPKPSAPYDAPVVDYWGELREKDKDLSMHYVNITTCVILIVVGLIFLYSSRTKRQTKRSTKKTRKKK
jgi:hypothetical protein